MTAIFDRRSNTASILHILLRRPVLRKKEHRRRHVLRLFLCFFIADKNLSAYCQPFISERFWFEKKKFSGFRIKLSR